jgi:hypothetical protein
MGYDLWPRPYRLRGFAGGLVRVSEDIRRGVVFIGPCHGSAPSDFTAKGTGFFVRHENCVYLVTAQHIAAGLKDHPFAIRINKKAGSSANIHVDPLMGRCNWHCNVDDSSIDLAVMPADFDFPDIEELDLLAIRSSISPTRSALLTGRLE